MEGHLELVRKRSGSRPEFDAFVLVISAGCRGWKTAAPVDVFDLLGSLDTQEKGT